jgi:hypothetical protein
MRSLYMHFVQSGSVNVRIFEPNSDVGPSDFLCCDQLDCISEIFDEITWRIPFPQTCTLALNHPIELKLGFLVVLTTLAVSLRP